MRILIVSHEASMSGAPRIAALTAQTFAEQGHSVRILARDSGPLIEDFRKVAQTSIEPLSRVRRRFWRLPNRFNWIALSVDTALALASILRHFPDLVYLNSNAAVIYLRPALWLRRPVVLHSHESADVAARFTGLAHADRSLSRATLVACSPSVRVSLARAASVSASAIWLVPSVPDASRVRAMSRLQPHYEFAPEEIVIGVCGTVEYRKGADLFLEVARLVRETIPLLRLRFVWIGPIRDELLLHGEDAQSFVGPLENPYPDMLRFDIAMLPSRDDPFPLVVLEAMLLARPVVAFEIGGVAEQLGDAGVLVPEQDVEAFAQALVTLIRDPTMRQDLGRKARERVETLYSVDAFAQSLARLTDEFRGGRRATAPPPDTSHDEVNGDATKGE